MILQYQKMDMSTLENKNSLEYIARSAEETQKIAYELAKKKLSKNSVLALHGELGSGKTCFVQGLAEALGVTRPITSPTFIIINRYDGIMPLFHADLYRIVSVDEIRYTALEECFEAGGITAIEWAERAENILPENTIHIYFEFLSEANERLIKIQNLK